MSGTQGVSAIDDFVYAQVFVGLKIQGSTNDAGYKENVKRMNAAEMDARLIAGKIKSAIEVFQKKHSGIEVSAIPKDYMFYENDMSGYQKFPTLISDEEAKTAKGTSCYFQLNKNPQVVVRFKTLPTLEVLTDLKTLVRSTVESKNAM